MRLHTLHCARDFRRHNLAFYDQDEASKHIVRFLLLHTNEILDTLTCSVALQTNVLRLILFQNDILNGAKKPLDRFLWCLK